MNLSLQYRDFRRSVPKNFAYFNVEFGLEGGYAHVIEDSAQFPQHFGHGILCGLSGEPSELVLRQRRQSRQQEMQRVQEFRTAWRKYDWTRILKKNASAAHPQLEQRQ